MSELGRCQLCFQLCICKACFPKTIISDASPSNSKTRENITKTASVWANVLNSRMAKISIVSDRVLLILQTTFPVRFPDIVDFATSGLSPVRSKKTDTCLQYHGLDTHTQTSKRDDKKTQWILCVFPRPRVSLNVAWVESLSVSSSP